MTAEDLYNWWNRDWREDAAQYAMPPEPPPTELSEDEWRERLVDLYGPDILEECME